MSIFDVIALDADDTLWRNEHFYSDLREKFVQLLAPYTDPDQISQCLYQTEMRNLPLYGYAWKN